MEYKIQSRLKNSLKWKYRKQHFLSFTDSAKESLGTLIAFAVYMAGTAYFGMHFFLYWVGTYQK